MPRLDRYQNPDLVEALAGDYVLGTMSGRARRRFAELVAERPYIHAAVLAWERRLNPLTTRLKAVAPHPRVWRRIRREIVTDRPARHTSLWQSLSLWRATTCAAVLGLAGALTYLATTPQTIAPPSYVAVLVDESQAPIIVATATQRPQRLMILRMQTFEVAPDADLELWAIPETDGAPVSIGLLSEDESMLMELDERDLRLIPKTAVLAISREPEGGSPTGSPTGPVLYQGKLVSL